MKKLFLIIAILTFLLPKKVFAGPSSTNYQLKEYGFGAGGGNGTSANYQLNGILGEVENGRPSSTNFKLGSGLNYTFNVNVPPAPTLSNPATDYDRLQFILNQGGNASDVTFAISISTDNFVTDIRYIKSDDTLGSTLTTSDFQTYSAWGGSGGAFVTTLANNTTYTIRAKARLGNFTETEWGPQSSAITTSNPSLTFSLDSSTLAFNNLNPGNSFTDSTKTTVLTTSTNAYNGYVIYAKSTGPLTSSYGSISDYGSTNSSPTAWSGTGFGYTTSDTNLTTGSGGAARFSGPNYAGFTTTASSNPVADDLGPVQSTAISNEQFTISYRITTPSTQPAGTYNSTINYIIVPTY